MLKLNQNYSDYTDETDENYPEGKAINASSSESVDGTPLLAEFMNDVNAAHIAMYEKAYGNRNGISGEADTQKVSQFADAVAKLVIDKIKAHADLRGLADGVHGATSEASSGQIASRDEFGNVKVGTAIDDSDAINLGDVKQKFEDADLKEASHRDVDTVVTADSENLPTSGAVNNALNALFPIGFVYQQLPGCPSPIEMNMYGTWVQLKLAGMSLRAEGGDAKPFTAPMLVTVSGTTVTVNVSDSATAESLATLAVGDLLIGGDEYRTVTAISGNTVTIDSAFSTEITTVLIGQNDQFQGHYHKTTTNRTNMARTGSNNMMESEWDYGANKPFTKETGRKTYEPYTDGTNGEPRVGNETRGKNLTVRYWKRIS